jgi:hypothetical protein
MIDDKKHLQLVVMLNNPKWWSVTELTYVMREELKKRGMGYIEEGTVSRNIRYFKEPKYGVFWEKKQVQKGFWLYRIAPKKLIKECSASEYASRK